MGGVGWLVSAVNGMTQTWWEIFWDGFLEERSTSHRVVANRAIGTVVSGGMEWDIYHVTEH